MTRLHPLALVAVFAGGSAGTGLRIALDAAFQNEPGRFPFATLLANLLGSFLLGAAIGRLWPGAPEWLRAGLGPGLLGGFTTFSAVMVSLIGLAEAREWPAAIAYLLLSVVLGLLAAALGLRVGRAAERASDIGADQ